MEIQVDITGALSFATRLDAITRGYPSILQMELIEGIAEVANRVVEMIRKDPEIPQEYKDSLAVVVLHFAGQVLIGPVWERAVLVERGSETDWLLYKCSKRMYYGGKLTSRFLGRNYLYEFWKTWRDCIMQDIRDTIRYRVMELFKL